LMSTYNGVREIPHSTSSNGRPGAQKPRVSARSGARRVRSPRLRGRTSQIIVDFAAADKRAMMENLSSIHFAQRVGVRPQAAPRNHHTHRHIAVTRKSGWAMNGPGNPSRKRRGPQIESFAEASAKFSGRSRSVPALFPKPESNRHPPSAESDFHSNTGLVRSIARGGGENPPGASAASRCFVLPNAHAPRPRGGDKRLVVV